MSALFLPKIAFQWSQASSQKQAPVCCASRWGIWLHAWAVNWEQTRFIHATKSHLIRKLRQFMPEGDEHGQNANGMADNVFSLYGVPRILNQLSFLVDCAVVESWFCNIALTRLFGPLACPISKYTSIAGALAPASMGTRLWNTLTEIIIRSLLCIFIFCIYLCFCRHVILDFVSRKRFAGWDNSLIQFKSLNSQWLVTS